tara:strand:+ start:630 stop:1592 length:963 start_codon:yes stop_codon:yes gene_type:complete
MTKQSRTTLKSFFNQGDVPTEGNYIDLIDSPIIMDVQNDGDIFTSGIISASGTGSNIFAAITASGEITASGTIFADNFKGDMFVDGGSTNNYMQFFSDLNQTSFVNGGTTTAKFDNAFIELNRPITASIISASSHISASTIITDSETGILLLGNITSSGNISSSGTIIANNFTSTGDNVGGINFSDGVLITGSITASNSISSSLTGSFAQLESLKFIGSRPIGTIEENTTLSLQHIGTYNRCGAHIVTIPLNSAVAFPVGTEIEFIQIVSSGHLLITASYNTAVTLNSRHNLLSASGQFSAISCKKVATDEWDIIGDLTK